jgi:hypothetical protein
LQTPPPPDFDEGKSVPALMPDKDEKDGDHALPGVPIFAVLPIERSHDLITFKTY